MSSSKPQTRAHALIEQRYVRKGETTRVIVLPLPEAGLPESLTAAGKPVPLDLLAGRPVNLDLAAEGFGADLCFGGPPVRCFFPWSAVVAVQSPGGGLEQTLTVTVAVRMNDGSLEALAPEDIGASAAGAMGAVEPEPATPGKGGLRLLRGGGTPGGD